MDLVAGRSVGLLAEGGARLGAEEVERLDRLEAVSAGKSSNQMVSRQSEKTSASGRMSIEPESVGRPLWPGGV